jgi:hypothetical protein
MIAGLWALAAPLTALLVTLAAWRHVLTHWTRPTATHQRLAAKVDQLDRQIRETRTRVLRLDTIIRDIESDLIAIQLDLERLSPTTTAAAALTATDHPIVEAIRQQGRPMTRNELAAALNRSPIDLLGDLRDLIHTRTIDLGRGTHDHEAAYTLRDRP